MNAKTVLFCVILACTIGLGVRAFNALGAAIKHATAAHNVAGV